MRVGTDERVGVNLVVFVDLHAFGDVLQIHLMHDARSGRHHAEIIKRTLSPAQKFITLAVALELDGGIVGKREGAVVLVYLHAMVDDQIYRNLRIDGFGVAAHTGHGAA